MINKELLNKYKTFLTKNWYLFILIEFDGFRWSQDSCLELTQMADLFFDILMCLKMLHFNFEKTLTITTNKKI